MSASPIARQATQFQSIPTRSILINDPTQLPVDYSTTPGGTLYSTTPGGTRIVYERAMLMQLRNSPIAQTPPKLLSNIPDILKTCASLDGVVKENGNHVCSPTKEVSHVNESLPDEQFQMEM